MAEKNFRVRKGLTVDGTGDSSIAGNLGIGTTSPKKNLHISDGSTSGISGGTTAALLITDDSNPRIYFEALDEASGNRVYDLAVGNDSFDGFSFNSLNNAASAYEKQNILTIHADGNVGIGTGTATPSTELEVAGIVTVTGNDKYITFDGGNKIVGDHSTDGLQIRNNENEAIVFKTNGNNIRMSIEGDGKVGIGTTSPATKLHIERNESDSENLMLRLRDSTVNATGERIGIEGYWNTVPAGDIEFELTNTSSGASAIVFSPHSSGGTKNEAMRIASDGKVGIGTTSPDTKMQIEGAQLTSTGQVRDLLFLEARTDSTNDCSESIVGTVFRFNTGAYTEGSLNRAAGVFGVNLDTAAGGVYGRRAGLAFYTSAEDATATEKMRIDSDGKVGIGTTSPKANLHVSDGSTSGITNASSASLLISDDANPRIYFEDLSEGAADRVFGIRYENEYLSFDSLNDAASAYDTQNIMVINRDGNVGIGTTAPAGKLSVQLADATSNGAVSTWDSTYALFGNAASTTGECVGLGFGTYGGVLVSSEPGTGYEPMNYMASTHYFKEDNTVIMTIDGGKVGIGTTSPASLLDVASASTSVIRLSNTDTALTEDQITGEIIFDQSDSTSGGDGISGRIGMRSATRPDNSTYYGNAADMGFFVSGATDGTSSNNAALEAMTIRAGGDVGIGTTTTSSGSKLDVNDDSTYALIKARGTSTDWINAGLLLTQKQASGTRGLGVFMHDENNDNEWFAGRSYGKEAYMIAYNSSASSHANSLADVLGSAGTPLLTMDTHGRMYSAYGGYVDGNMISTHSWFPCSDLTTLPRGFILNGSATENSIVWGETPMGFGDDFGRGLLWRFEDSGDSGAGGGFLNANPCPRIDPEKTYRLSCWIKRSHINEGSYYIGAYGLSNETGSNQGLQDPSKRGTLDGAATAGATTLDLNSDENMPDPGGDTRYAVINMTDVITYTGKSGDQLTGIPSSGDYAIASNHADDTVVLYVEQNAYFGSGDLPAVDKWYLLVGYIRGKGDTGDYTDRGAIYDGETGMKTADLGDYMWMPTNTHGKFRVYLYYSDNSPEQIQHAFDPRFEELSTAQSLTDYFPLRGEGLTSQSQINIKEQASAITNVAAYGQLWVKNSAPNELYFTDDTGVDIPISSIPNGANNRVLTATGASGMNAEANMTFDGSLLHMTSGSGYLKFETSGSVGSIKSDFNLDLYADDTNGNSDSYQNIRFFPAGTEAMRVAHDGKVGIGTTAPATNLHIADTGTTHITPLRLDNGLDTDGARGVGMDFRVRFGSTNIHTSQIYFDFYGDKWTDSIGMNYVSGRSGSFSHHHFRDQGGAVQLMIADSGNVGIDSSYTHAAQPAAKLDIKSSDGSIPGLQVYRNDSSTSSALVYIHDDSIYGDNAALHVKQDSTASYGNAALFEGNVGINTTAPIAALEVQGAGVLTRTAIVTISGNTNLSGVSHAGRLLHCTSACTLSLQATPTAGEQQVVYNDSTGTITIAANGSDTINGSTNDVTITTRYKAVTFIAVSASAWLAIGA